MQRSITLIIMFLMLLTVTSPVVFARGYSAYYANNLNSAEYYYSNTQAYQDNIHANYYARDTSRYNRYTYNTKSRPYSTNYNYYQPRYNQNNRYTYNYQPRYSRYDRYTYNYQPSYESYSYNSYTPNSRTNIQYSNSGGYLNYQNYNYQVYYGY